MKPVLLEMAVIVLAVAVTACATGRSSPADGAGLDIEPRRIECPSEHRDRNGWDGVTFRFTVLPNGTVDASSVRLTHDRDDRVSSPDTVERAELELLQCSFEPGTSNGQPVSAVMTMRVAVEPRSP